MWNRLNSFRGVQRRNKRVKRTTFLLAKCLKSNNIVLNEICKNYSLIFERFISSSSGTCSSIISSSSCLHRENWVKNGIFMHSLRLFLLFGSFSSIDLNKSLAKKNHCNFNQKINKPFEEHSIFLKSTMFFLLFSRISSLFFPLKGLFPVNIIYSMTPKEKTSHFSL